MPQAVVLDTSVLFPPSLRDTLLRCAEAGLYAPRWSPDILDELQRSLSHDAGLTEPAVNRLIVAMTERFPAARVDDYQYLVSTLTNHPKDRHIVATAIQAKANRIVTLNLKDFSAPHLLPHQIDAQSPDEFLMEFAAASFTTMQTIIEMQVRALYNPPLSLAEVLIGLEGKTPRFARLMRDRMLADQQ